MVFLALIHGEPKPLALLEIAAAGTPWLVPEG